MEGKQNRLSPEDSLRLIGQMIDDTRQSYQHSSFYFLLWGWLLMLTGIGIFILTNKHVEEANVLWLVQGIVGGITSMVYSKMQDKKVRESKAVTSPVNRGILNIWLGFGITLFFIIFAAVNSGTDPIPFVLLVTGYATFMSGKVIRFNPLIFGGICFWAFGVMAFFVAHPYSALVFSVAILVGYLVPGYLLRLQEKQRLSVQRA